MSSELSGLPAVLVGSLTKQNALQVVDGLAGLMAQQFHFVQTLVTADGVEIEPVYQTTLATAMPVKLFSRTMFGYPGIRIGIRGHDQAIWPPLVWLLVKHGTSESAGRVRQTDRVTDFRIDGRSAVLLTFEAGQLVRSITIIAA